MSELLMLSDVLSSLSIAVFGYIHSQKGLARSAAYSLVSSVAGRYVSMWLSGGFVDAATSNMITPQIKDNLVMGLVRAAIGMVAKEQHVMVKTYDAVLCDILAQNLVVSSGYGDKSLLGGFGKTPAAPPK